LRDIVDNVDAIEAFTAELDLGGFHSGNRKTVYAVVRALEIISERHAAFPRRFTSRRARDRLVAIAAAGQCLTGHEYEAVRRVP